MEQTITAKLQIVVSPSDKQILRETMKAYTNACNYVSECMICIGMVYRIRPTGS